MDIAFFRTHALTKGLNKAELERLKEMLTEQRFAQGDELCIEGATPKGLFLVREGCVKVTKRSPAGKSRELTKLEGPTVLGEMELISGEGAAASVVAETDGVAYLLSNEAFEQLLEEGDSAVSKLMRNIARVVVYRLMETNARFASQIAPEKKKDFESITDALHAAWQP